jgi:hypothetical protein
MKTEEKKKGRLSFFYFTVIRIFAVVIVRGPVKAAKGNDTTETFNFLPLNKS